MASRSLLAITTSLLTAGIMALSIPASAETLLTKATVQRLRNKVEIHLKQKQLLRQAQKADVMTPGDALRTFQKAMAELRFNDNSLARIGEQAVFYFEPNTRNFQLDSGTVLLLIQPGQGKTRIRTPNAAAGIRGSALFVRYLPDTQVTMVGALTNSDIEISNKDGVTVILKAGQIGYVYQDRIGVYNFDQKQFQETSPFFKEIDWNEAPIAVKEEIDAALTGQQTFTGKYDDTPLWTKLAENRSTPPQQNFATADRIDAQQFPTGRVPVVISNPPGNQPQQPSQIGAQPEVRPDPQPIARPEPQPITQPVTRPEPTVPTTPSTRPEPITTPSAPVAPPVASTTPNTTQPAVPSQPIQSTPPTSQTPSATTPPTRPAPSITPPTTTTPVSTTPTVTPPTTTPVNNTPTVTPPTTTTPVSVTPPTTTTPVSTAPVTPPTTTTPVTPTTPTRAEPVVTPTPAAITPPVQPTPTVTPSVTPVVNSAPVTTAPPQTTPAVTTPVATPAVPQTPASVSTTPATSPLDLPSVQPAASTATTTPAATTTTTTTTTPTRATP